MRSRPLLDVIGLPKDLLKKIFQGDVSRFYLEYTGKGRMVWWQERLNALCDSLSVCRFLSVFSSPHAPRTAQFCKLLELAFGEQFSEEELLKAYRFRFIWEKSFSESCPFHALVQWNDDIDHCDLCGGQAQCVRVCSTGAVQIFDKGGTTVDLK